MKTYRFRARTYYVPQTLYDTANELLKEIINGCLITEHCVGGEGYESCFSVSGQQPQEFLIYGV